VNRTQQKRRPKRLVLKRHRAPLAKRPHAFHQVDPLTQHHAPIPDPARAEVKTVIASEISPGGNPDPDPQTISSKSEIHQILVPVDAIHTKLSDFSPILRMARRLEATVTLLHCYVAPPSFDFAVGDAALAEVSLHCRRVRARLYELATAARHLYRNCVGRVALGSPATQIVRQSRALKADLIAVPLPLDLIRWCWLPEELLDELVRTADCPVLCVPAQKFHPEELPTSMDDLDRVGHAKLAEPVLAGKNSQTV
jgi:nucleotide-binding universal stress UspA family protein